MKREFPSQAVQRQSSVLHNQICRLSTPKEMAAVSAHLRNYVVAETVAIIGSLDSHPKIIGPPCVFGSPATHQQARGTRPNPFTHVAPSGLRIANTENPTAFEITS